MNKYLRPLAVIAFIALIAFGFYYQNHLSKLQKQKPIAGKNVVVFGDSLVAGVGSANGANFVNLLARDLNVPIINAGHSGDTTAAAMLRLQSDVLEQDPRVVVVLLGGNDFLRGVSFEQTIDNLGTMIDKIHATGSAVLLVGFDPGLVFTKSYSSAYRDLAEQKNVAYVPNVLSGLVGDKKYMYDAVHPNNAGYEIVARRIKPVLQQLLQ